MDADASIGESAFNTPLVRLSSLVLVHFPRQLRRNKPYIIVPMHQQRLYFTQSPQQSGSTTSDGAAAQSSSQFQDQDDSQTVKRWILWQYEDQKEKVKQRIQSAKSRIHISCDLQTSPNALAILGVVTHYITEDCKLEHHTLALKDINREHNRSHLAAAIIDVINDQGFASKLRYFVMDNAGNNDTIIKCLSLSAYHRITHYVTLTPHSQLICTIALLRQYDIQYDPTSHRLRCQGHIINLAAKSFLFITDKEKIKCNDSRFYNVTLKQIKAQRRKGPLGKLHNFMVYIQQSVQRCQKFMAISQNRKLTQDNDTRWNSQYLILRAALHLRDAIKNYFKK